MSDDEFNVDELLSRNDEEGYSSKDSNTNNTDNTCTTSNTKNPSLHPFSVRLDEKYVEIIKSLSWWKRIAQREFLEEAIDKVLEELNPEELNKVIRKFNQNESN